jgi:hypothetical protein
MIRTHTVLLALSLSGVAGTLGVLQGGCSSSTSAAPADAGPGDTGTTTPNGDDAEPGDALAAQPDAGDAGSPGVNVTWQITVRAPAFGQGPSDASAPATPLAGVSVCVYQMAGVPCVTTDAQGAFTLKGVPAQGEFVITADKAGYRSLAQPMVTMGVNVNAATVGPLAMAAVSDPDPPVGAAIDWVNKGQVEFFVLGPGALVPDSGPEGVPGATVTFTPASGVGPVFLSDENSFDASAKTLIDALGGVYNVDPGNYTLTFTAANADCENIVVPVEGFGYPGGAHQVTFPVIKGYTTTVGTFCNATSAVVSTDAGADGASDGGSEN